MKKYRVYFKKNGINLTKLVYAESVFDVTQMFEGSIIIQIKEIDPLPLEDEI
jgi:hypothetical protein